MPQSGIYLSLLTALFSASSFALTVTSDGSDGDFIPALSTTLTVPDDGIFNFSKIEIKSGVDITFNRGGFNDTIWLASVSDISILGDIAWTGSLGISAYSGDIDILFDGPLTGGNALRIESEGNTITLGSNSDITVPDGTISLTSYDGGSLTLNSEITVVDGSVTADTGSSGAVSLSSGGPLFNDITTSAIGSVTVDTGSFGAVSLLSGDPSINDITTSFITIAGSIGNSHLTIDNNLTLPTQVPLPLPLFLFASALGLLVPAFRPAVDY